MPKKRDSYHHGNLAESLLDAVNTIAEQFGIEAVTLRGCAKHIGVAPSSAFRHYTDKRALMTAFATRALQQLTATLDTAHHEALKHNRDSVREVGLAYIEYAVSHPALFRGMWREEAIYAQDSDYAEAAAELQSRLCSVLDEKELLLWSAVHGLAHLFVDGTLGNQLSLFDRMKKADQMLSALHPALADTRS